ncbi:MAG: ROK family protein, partial [Limisphaera sp.]|nr:ROK family protein [Limisphaera sp.]
MQWSETWLSVAPRVRPPLDPGFRPMALAYRKFLEAASETPGARPVTLALEQLDGLVSHHRMWMFPADDPRASANFPVLERVVKTLLWSRGGWRLHIDGPPELVAALQRHYRESPTGRFDEETVARRMFDHPLEIVATCHPPPERASSLRLGRHWEGCRIGFDLGGSDRKVAAVKDGEVLFSEETPWDPYFQKDPQYHYEGIMDSLRRAA